MPASTSQRRTKPKVRRNSDVIALTTPLSNAELGEYFRNRLNLAYGAPVTEQDLKQYGRTNVSFIKYDDEQYFMDFSVTEKG